MDTVLGECSALWGECEGIVWCISAPCTITFPLAYISLKNSLIPRFFLPPTVKLQVENAWGRGYIGYQMYAGICGAI